MTPTSLARHFVPATLDVSSFATLAPLFEALETRVIHNVHELEQWLHDTSELAAVLSEVGARRYIDMTCHTDDAAAEKAYLDWVENIQPQLKPHWQKLDELYLASPYRQELPRARYLVFDRNTANDAALFRPENIPLQTEEAKLDQQYNKISGAMTVEFDGRERTMPQMARYLEETDRTVRQSAWEAMKQRRMRHVAEFDELYDKQIALRQQMARNAGCFNYVEYAFRMYRRFDYNSVDCFSFHAAVEQSCVPLARNILEKRRQLMKLDRLRPWDLAVDPFGRPALRPFDSVDRLCDGVQSVFEKLDGELASQFRLMRQRKLLDLDSRKGKAPGGYQYTLDESRVPFIFMNAAGMDGDLRTLFHESGHAFHALAAANDPLLAYRAAPIEFCEVASMSMELLTIDLVGEFYRPEEQARAKRQLLEGIVMLLPWIAQIDAFQHWVYSQSVPRSHEERNAHWIELTERFGPGPVVDMEGYKPIRRTEWQRQRHLWGNPFYYIEYGIAQLGALQLWAHALKDPRGALEAYRRALALGGSRPLPELFQAAEIRFDFSPATLKPLMALIEDQLLQISE